MHCRALLVDPPQEQLGLACLLGAQDSPWVGWVALALWGQPLPLSGQPPPGTSGMAPHGMAVVSTATPQSEYYTPWQVTLHAILVLSVLMGKVSRSPDSSVVDSRYCRGML